MKVIRHYIEMSEDPPDDNWWGNRGDGFIMDNRDEPVVRIGGEPFECRYDFDYYQIANFICDPTRSLVCQVYAATDKVVADFWSFTGFVEHLAKALGLRIDNCPGNAMIVAYWTMFPRFLSFAEFRRWMGYCAYNNQVKEMPRVINNPFFYTDPNAAETRLLEIAQDSGCTYAIDLANEAASAETLAREIALLNHIHEGDASVESAHGRILLQIADVLA